MGWLYLVHFIFLPPLEAAPSERLSRAAGVTRTRPARRKKQLRGGKQIRCRGPEVLPPPAAHPGATTAFAQEGKAQEEKQPWLWDQLLGGDGGPGEEMDPPGAGRGAKQSLAVAARHKDGDVPSAPVFNAR